ncbi:MAG: LysR substrate-binding domain-containing protein [Rhodospirillaceae bacterium]
MAFEPSTLELFLRVAALGAFGKAGQEFGLSPTAVTQRIKGLEAELGVRLFTRSTRAVALTSDGALFQGHARRILQSIEDARSDLTGGSRNIQGELRVTGSASFGRKHIAPYIAEFLEGHPQVRVRLELTDAMVDIVEQGFDLALRIGALSPSALVARKLADNPRVLVASPAYLQRLGRPKAPADLAQHNCLVLGDARSWSLRDPSGQSHVVRVKGNFSTNHGEVTTEAALADAGIALKSLWDVRSNLAEGSLISVLEDYTVEPEWSLWAVRPPGAVVPARVRAFIDFMEQKFRKIDDRAGSAALSTN